MCSLNVYFVFFANYYSILLCVGERGERAKIFDDSAHVKGHGRRHANSNDSITS